MKLASISIQNFRGIKTGSFFFPQESRLICLIGAGDSCKSTFLKAIEWCFWPTWSLLVTDLDFHNCNTSSPIVIEASIAEMPQELLTEEKFGLFLRDYDAVVAGKENDEPVEGGKIVITVRLTINETLEPIWSVITNRSDPRPISHKDRSLFTLGVVGLDYEKDFVWGRTSVLQHYSESSQDVLHTAYMQAMRTAVEKTDFSSLDQTTKNIKEIGKRYGVPFNGDLHNRLLMQNGRYSTAVGMFDDRVPLFLRGLGSKRLLSMGMNINVSKAGCLMLIDELETGLEPYRICTLINQLRSDFKDKGQIIFTTHSESAICECEAEELFIMNMKDDSVSLFPLVEQDVRDEVQRLIRYEPHAFLCKRIIVCEGKTEIGLLKAFETFIYRNTSSRFAYHGVGMALGAGGDNLFKLTMLLYECGYDVCILMDSDVLREKNKKEECEKMGISVFSWAEGNAIEEEIFADSNVDTVEELIKLACRIKTLDHVIEKIKTLFPRASSLSDLQDLVIFVKSCSKDDFRKLGTIAKENKWFKQIASGQHVGDIVFNSYESMDATNGFKRTMGLLYKWVNSDET